MSHEPIADVDAVVTSVDRRVVPAVTYMRTKAERRDQELSWRRPGQAFFASGACHVLAFRFLARSM